MGWVLQLWELTFHSVAWVRGFLWDLVYNGENIQCKMYVCCDVSGLYYVKRVFLCMGNVIGTFSFFCTDFPANMNNFLFTLSKHNHRFFLIPSCLCHNFLWCCVDICTSCILKSYTPGIIFPSPTVRVIHVSTARPSWYAEDD